MMDEQNRRRAAALTRVHEELVAELDGDDGHARYAELQPLVADVEWALSQCRTYTVVCLVGMV